MGEILKVLWRRPQASQGLPHIGKLGTINGGEVRRPARCHLRFLKYGFGANVEIRHGKSAATPTPSANAKMGEVHTAAPSTSTRVSTSGLVRSTWIARDSRGINGIAAASRAPTAT